MSGGRSAHLCVWWFGHPVAVWGFVLHRCMHGLHCSYHHKVKSNVWSGHYTSGVPDGAERPSPLPRTGRTGAHRSPNAPSTCGRGGWRARVQTSGGQCRHSRNSLIRFRSHSPRSSPLCKQQNPASAPTGFSFPASISTLLYKNPSPCKFQNHSHPSPGTTLSLALLVGVVAAFREAKRRPRYV